MPTIHAWSRPVSPLLLICFLLTGCYRQSLERGAFDPAGTDDYFVEMYLKDGQKIKGLFLAETQAYVILSVKDLPEEMKQAQAIPLIVSEKSVTLYKKSGKPVSGRIVSIEEGLVEIKRADLRLGLKRLKHTFVEQDKIATVLPMGRPGEAQLTFLNSDFQSIKIKGPRVGEKETEAVLFGAGTVIFMGIIFLAWASRGVTFS